MDRLLVVALLAQSLVIFEATKGSFSNSMTRVWPSGIQLLDTVMVLSLHVVLMLFALSNPLKARAEANRSTAHTHVYQGGGPKNAAAHDFHSVGIG